MLLYILYIRVCAPARARKDEVIYLLTVFCGFFPCFFPLRFKA